MLNLEKPKYLEYDGLKFCRDEKTGYYLNSTIRERIHRYIWEKEVGAIPEGCHIHHLNGDKSDNRIENLAIMTGKGHLRMHMAEQARKDAARENVKKAIAAAPAWHKSEAGRAWHSKQATGRKPKRETKICDVCGKPFEGTKTQRFCSNACKAKYRRIMGLDDIERTCGICGKTFKSTRFHQQKFCSNECKRIAHIGWKQRKLAKQG